MSATVTVVCPNCKNKMRASAEHLGRKGRCPACKAIVDVMSADASLATLLPTSGAAKAERGAQESTDVKGWLAALIGAGATVVLYLVIFIPIGATYLGNLFVDRGPVPVVTTFVSCWGFALLALKYVAVKRQMAVAEMELELIPLEIGLQITPDNVDQFLGHLAALPPQQQGSILARRIRGAIEHFKHRASVPEVQGYLSSQSEIDASGVEGGYTLLRSIVWAVPILGFIGTVLGISAAVEVLGKATSQKPAAVTESSEPRGSSATGPQDETKSQAAKLGEAMPDVIHNLAVAFDTTLVGLALAIFLLFMTESLRKTEYGMLDRIEQFANESLLRRMVDKEPDSAPREAPEVVRDALDAAFKEHQRWLAQWQAQVGELGRVIGADFEASVVNVQQRIGEAERQRLDGVRNAARMVEELFARLNHTASQWENSAQRATHDVGASLAASDKLHATLVENNRLMTEVLDHERQLLAAALVNPPLPADSVPMLAPVMAPPTASTSHRVADGRIAPPRGGLWQRLLGRAPPEN